jgi:SEC-C motif-containing protein
MTDGTSPCPCTSGRTFADCCEPFLTGKARPATAEALMRSRYSAYATQRIDYIADTDHPSRRAEFDRKAATEWSTRSEWLGLEVGAIEAGGPDDDDGVVEFTARFRLDGKEHRHRERATFARVDRHWTYLDGAAPPQKPFVKDAPAVGRNDLCPCGSGKKHKKCCGK